MSKKTRVALYARVSIDAQAEKGKSVPAQIAEMYEYAANRNWTVVAEFKDPGISGTTLDRPGLEAALEAARQGTYDVLLVHELSRLSRRLFDTFAIFEELGNYQVGFAAVKDKDFDLTSPTDRLFLTFMSGLNQYYIDLLKMHTAKGKRQRAREGLYNASIPPYGYRHVGDSETPPVIVEEEAAIVREIFELYSTGKHSYADVAEWMTDVGYKTRTGNNFSKDTLADILRNPFYKGFVRYRQGERGQDAGELFPGKHEAIVSAEVWDMCRQIRQQRRSAPRTYQPKYRVYLLNGIITCDVCGRNLRAQGAKAGSYYREVSKQRGFTDCPSSGRGARMEHVDEQVSALFRQLRLPRDWQDELRALMEEDDGYDTLKDRRARLIHERKRLKLMKIKGEFDTDEEIYQRELARIQRQLAELPAPGDFEAMEQAADVLEELAETWDEAELVDRRDLLRLAIREVKIDVPQARVATIEPYPIFVPLFRRAPLLRETGFGVFTPVWTPDLVEAFEPLVLLPSDEGTLDPKRSPDWPLVTTLPDEVLGQRINPVLSKWLKTRRKKGLDFGRVVELVRPGVPPLKYGPRKWPEVEVERVADLDDLAAGSVQFLWTPFALQRSESVMGVIATAHRVVAPGGTWAFVDVMPESMPGHWLYYFFPEVGQVETRHTFGASQLYNTLVESGFSVHQERHTFHQSILLTEALRIARKRSRIPLLANLPDQVYETRLDALEDQVQAGAGEFASECCLVQVAAVRVS